MIKNYIFTGHESFSLREGWLTKGINAIKNLENKGKNGKEIFSKSEIYNTIDELGIGSNMVKSLKFWLEVFDILLENGEINPIIKEILRYDIYFQNKDTLWILHFLIFNPNRYNREILLWNIVSRKNNYNSFEKAEMIDLINSETGKKYSNKSIESTLTTFIKTYYYDNKSDYSNDPETNLISPFTKLNLLSKNEKEEYIFREVNFEEINIYLGYLIIIQMFNYLKVKTLEIKEAYSFFKKIIKMNSYNFDMLLKNIENEKIISIDRAAGLNNINIITELTQEKIIEKIYQI